MTPNERLLLVSKITKSLKDHLSKLGYPKMGNDQIMAELPRMWIKIEKEGLTNNLSYRDFVQHAHNQSMLAQMMGIFR